MFKNSTHLAVAFLFFGNSGISQSTDTTSAFLFSSPCVSMVITPALTDIPYTPAYEVKDHVVYNNMRRKKYTNADALPAGTDPVWQKKDGLLTTREPIQNWAGNPNGAFPPDPSGAAGPDHYVQMINSEYIIYDKEGTILLGPNSLESIVGSDAGDPIVMYDRFADRWLLSAFGVGDQLSVAISTSPNPMGSYYLYTFDLESFPDYPKYGLWHDGYYVTSNTSGADCFIFEREKMLLGDPTASMIAMTIPSLGTGGGTETGDFHSVLPAHADFALPPSTKKLNLFYFQDDAWAGITDDAIKVWEVTTNWLDPELSDISLIQTLNTTPFDSQFNVSWNDIRQPGTSQRLDAVPGAFMYRAQYTEWGAHNTVMLNHTVDVDATNHGGIRWYELREIGGVWSIYQESTFAPDDQSRWMGSISMDFQGNIGLAYSVSGSVVYPSIRYTGRYASDPLNTMTISEITAIAGTSVQTGINRFGDYAHMSVDPTDNATFWYTGEYISGGRKTRIFSFKLASDFDNDLGVTALNSPIDGALGATETIEITIANFGLNPQDDFPVSYQINGGTIVTETYTSGPIDGGGTDIYTFATTANMAAPGAYEVKLWTGLLTDEFNLNDTLVTTINNIYANDIGVVAINAPISGTGLGMENIDVTIENFGAVPQTDFEVAFQVGLETPVSETVAGPLNPGETITYTFTTSADFTAVGPYNVWAYTQLAGDGDLTNDTTFAEVIHFNCTPSADCSFGDGFTRFKLGTIDNASGCSPSGYADFSDFITDLTRGTSHSVTVECGWDPQFLTMWIDYNDNFYFEPDEKVIAGFSFGFGGTTNFLLPADAPLGEHLIRIKASDVSENTSDPCSDMPYGETEDYRINILPSETGEIPIVDFIADMVVAPVSTTISFADLSTGTPTDWAWTLTPGSGWSFTGGTTAASQNPEIVFDTEGLYTVSLTAENEFGSGMETKINYIQITHFDELVENAPFGIELIAKEYNNFQFQVLGSTSPFTVEIHNNMGQLIFKNNIQPTGNKTPVTIDLGTHASGYYLLRIYDTKHSKVQKIWVQ